MRTKGLVANVDSYYARSGDLGLHLLTQKNSGRRHYF
jgi:hypothetical protein